MMRLCVELLNHYFQFQVCVRIISVVDFTRNWKIIFSIAIKLAYQPLVLFWIFDQSIKNSKKKYFTISYLKHKGSQTKVLIQKYSTKILEQEEKNYNLQTTALVMFLEGTQERSNYNYKSIQLVNFLNNYRTMLLRYYFIRLAELFYSLGHVQATGIVRFSGSLAIQGNNQTVLIIFTALRIVLINISIKVFKTLPDSKVIIWKCYQPML